MRGSRIISVGLNKTAAPKRFTMPYHRPNLHLHAEVSAIYNIDKESLKGSTLVINGETVSGTPINSKPCYNCLQALESAGIRRILYNNKGIIKEIK